MSARTLGALSLIVFGLSGSAVVALALMTHELADFAEGAADVLALEPSVHAAGLSARTAEPDMRQASAMLSPSVIAQPRTPRDAADAGVSRGRSLATLGAHAATAEAAAATARCPRELRLLGSVVNAARPEHSLAAVRVHGGTRLLRVGDRVDGLTVVALRPARAYLQPDQGPACVLPVFLPAGERAQPAPVQPAKAARAVRPKKRPLFEAAELREGIRVIAPNTFGVSRELLQKALGNVAALRRGGRFRIKSEDGKARGLELVAVRKESPLEHMGLRKGDLIRKLNGLDLSQPDGALQAFGLVRSQSRFTLAIQRDGAAQTLTYQVE